MSRKSFGEALSRSRVKSSRKQEGQLLLDSRANFDQGRANPVNFDLSTNFFCAIGLITVFDAILTDRQSGKKLQCLYENPMANKFFHNRILKKIVNRYVKILSGRLYSPSLEDIA